MVVKVFKKEVAPIVMSLSYYLFIIYKTPGSAIILVFLENYFVWTQQDIVIIIWISESPKAVIRPEKQEGDGLDQRFG